MMHELAPKLQSTLGLVAIFAFAYLLSENRSRARLRVAIVAGAIQLGIALVFLKFPPLRQVFFGLNQGVLALQGATEAGTSFVFGYLGGAPLPFQETRPGASFVLAFRALPLIIVISALTSLLMYWRILPLARDFGPAGKALGHRRRRSLGSRREHFRRNGRGTAIYSSLSFPAFSQ
jgi:nucleoside permease NupC